MRYKGGEMMQLEFPSFGAIDYQEIINFDRLLVRLKIAIDWNMFAPVLEKVFNKDRKSNAGRPSYNLITMFKILVYQRLNNLSDKETHHSIVTNFEVQWFLDKPFWNKTPDPNTIWNFRNKLVKAQVQDELFDLFNKMVRSKGIINDEVNIVDSTFADVPRQHNTPEQNKAIKAGGLPPEWQKNDAKTRHMLAQKDLDARPAKKRDKFYYGYKDHIKIDKDSKMIVRYSVTPANVNDGKEMKNLVTADDKVVYADSAYVGQEKNLPKGVKYIINERPYRGHPLTDEQKANNKIKSKVRIRVEHVFAYIKMSFCGFNLRCKGLKRAAFAIGLTNLVYNICRYETLVRLKCAA